MSSVWRKQSGFTLMEVMAVAAVSGVLAAFSLPMVNSLKAEQAAGVVSDFAESVKTARELAVSSGTAVSVCASADGLSCSGDWKDGWIVYLDNASGEVASDNVAHYANLQPGTEIHVYTEQAELASRLQFDSRGYSKAGSRLTVSFCADQSAMNTLVVEPTGRMLDTTGNEAFQKAFIHSVNQAHSQIPSQCNPA